MYKNNMTLNELTDFLYKRVLTKNLYIACPMNHISFAGDNFSLLKEAFHGMALPTVVTVRQFTDTFISVPITQDPLRRIPIKNIASFFITADGCVMCLTKNEIIECYSIDQDNQIIIPDPDLEFMDSVELLQLIA
ncbi:MAG: hypothetical protein HRT88_08520 [Lentisphaeraceae bacterium]|nr:hypothetical protein [Lentisphaeraceae bacterium]